MREDNMKAGLSHDEQIGRVVAEFLESEEADECPDPSVWLSRYPELRSALNAFFRNHQAFKHAEEASLGDLGQHDPQGKGPGSDVVELVRPGQVVGDCQIGRKLGQGGMGVVYQATHVRLKDPRAVKFLPCGEVTDNMIRRFWREAQTAASIKHPNVITVHDIGRQGNLHYIVMEYVDGRTLSELHPTEVARSSYRVFSWITAARLIVPVLDALHVVHGHGLVHRDVKPSNVMVTRTSEVVRKSHIVLMDFGLVQDESDATVTQSGAIVGTPAYMSREQALGWQTDERSDVFSVGATLYFLLTGRHPHHGAKNVVLARAAAGVLPVPLSELRPDLPPEIGGIVERAMDPDRGRRFAGAEEMLNELVKLLRSVSKSRLRSTTPSKIKRDVPEVGPPSELEDTVTYRADTEGDDASLDRIPLELLLPETEQGKAEGGSATSGRIRPPADGSPESGKVTSSSVRSLRSFWGRLNPTNKSIISAVVGALLVAVTVGVFILWTGPEAALPPPSPPKPDQLKYEGMVFIPAGIVQIGASERRLRSHAMTLDAIKDSPELIRQFVEKCMKEPFETVHVKGFWIDKYEVTNAEYAKFVKAAKHPPPAHWREDQPPAGKDDHPVTRVRYSDAAAYAAWAGKQLPTIGQWMRAFRGGDDWMYPWGDEWKPRLANVGENASFPLGTSSVLASPLDETQFGVRNMVGNVSEIIRERTLKEGLITAIRKGAHSESDGAIYGTAPFRFFLIGENITHPLTGFRCVIEE